MSVCLSVHEQISRHCASPRTRSPCAGSSGAGSATRGSARRRPSTRGRRRTTARASPRWDVAGQSGRSWAWTRTRAGDGRSRTPWRLGYKPCRLVGPIRKRLNRSKRIVTLLNLYALYKKLLCMYVCMYVCIQMPFGLMTRVDSKYHV